MDVKKMAQIVDNIKGRIQSLESVFGDFEKNPTPEGFATSIRALCNDDPEFKTVYGRVGSNTALQLYISALNKAANNEWNIMNEITLKLSQVKYDGASLLLGYEVTHQVDIPQGFNPDLPPAFFDRESSFSVAYDRPDGNFGNH